MTLSVTRRTKLGPADPGAAAYADARCRLIPLINYCQCTVALAPLLGYWPCLSTLPTRSTNKPTMAIA